MEDVIFHGTIARKQMGYARVALSIDNTDRTLGRDCDEIVITRCLYRTGESEYMINGEKVRLKDIHDLLMGTGLGRDGYSIIGQGRVAEIVNAKGTQRREIFEEAAGVSKFLHQKDDAERELKRSEDNIIRLKDIASTLEERLPTLQKQSEKAAKAKILIEQEKSLEISVTVSELDRIEASLTDIGDKILMNEGECEHFEREIAELEEENEQLAEKKMRLSAELEQLRRSSSEARDRIADIDKEIAVMETEISHNNRNIDEIRERIELSGRSAEEFDRQAEELNKLLAEKGQASAQAEKKIAEGREKLTRVTADSEKSSDEYKELDSRQSMLYAKQTEAKLAVQTAQKQLEDITGALSSSDEHIENQNKLLDECRAKRKALQRELDELSEEKSEAENKVDGYSRLISGKNEKLEQAKTKLENLRRTFEQKKSRYDILSDVERNMAGYFPSVKAVISAAKAGKLSDIDGTVADVIRVEPKYGTAIEIALGNALQNIIVKNEETAKRCIRYLKEQNAGRATFYPLTSINGTALNVKGLDDEDGFEGYAYQLVDNDSKYDKVILSVLGKTAVVDDIDTATYLAKKYEYRFRIVTLDGQVVNAGGSFTGGSVKNNVGIISRKQEIDAISIELEKLTSDIEESKAAFGAVSAEVGKMNLEFEGYKEKIQQLRQEEIRLTAEIGGVKNLIEQCNEQLDNSELMISTQKKQQAQQLEIIEKYSAVIEQTEREIAEMDELIAKADEELAKASEIKNSISSEITQLNMDKLSYEKDMESIRLQLENVRLNKENAGADTERAKEEIKSLQAINENISEMIKSSRLKIEEANRSFDDKGGEIEQTSAKIAECEKRVGEINREIREKSEHKEHFSNALVLAREKKENTEREGEKLKTTLWDKYEISLSEARGMAQPLENPKASANELTELRRKISALGPINFASIEEYEEVSARYGELSGQLTDIEKAKHELEKLISNLTAEIKAKFLSSFNEINEQFSRIFREIFGGGSAHLELMDPDDVLGSGIEIKAAPPGKVIKNLISLSGGEQAMVAITIYFAILLHRPTPFCMLDEVDAPLDDVNVVKYSSYLKRFCNNTQLMIISHRRGTIEECDVLYGVFMQEKGVSRLMRQEITDDLDIELT